MDNETDTFEDDDATALKVRREALRALVEDIARHTQSLDLPKTWLDAERCARCVTVHDRALQVLPIIAADTLTDADKSALKPVRRDLRAFADRLMQAATGITKPDSFLQSERAGRYALAADRMLTQLYEAPAPTLALAAAKPVATAQNLSLALARTQADRGLSRVRAKPTSEDDASDADDYPSAYGPPPPNDTREEWIALIAFKIDRGDRPREATPKGQADRWRKYLTSRVPDYNPSTGAYEPNGDLNAIRNWVSATDWAAICEAIAAQPDRYAITEVPYDAESAPVEIVTPAPPAPPLPPPKPPPEPETLPDTGPRIRRF